MRPERSHRARAGDPAGALRTSVATLGLALSACGILAPTAYSGEVVAPGGKPLAGVVVSSPDGSTLTDDAGGWQLATGARTLTFRKPGYQVEQLPARSPVVTLPASSRPLQVVFDDRWDGLASTGLQQWLARQGMQVYDLKAGTNPATADVMVLLSPAYFTRSQIDPLLSAVRSGQTLLLAGQWGGYAGTDLGTLNTLSAGTGIQFDGSLVRDRAATDSVDAFVPLILEPAIAPANAPEFFSAGSLGVSSPAHVLLRSGPRSYRVSAWADAPQDVGAVAPLGAGKIIALSDAACFSDLPEGSAQQPGWQIGGNAQLALALIGY